MPKQNRYHAGTRSRPGCTYLLIAVTMLGAGACTPRRHKVQADSPALAEYIALVMPARVRILEWTKPVSFAGDGNADGLEVILAAYDALDDETKAVGTFHFELQTRRVSEHIGRRLAFWPVEVTSARDLRAYLDHPTGFYRFPLKLDPAPLPPGRYALTVWLHLPTGRRLSGEYEFSYDGGRVPTVQAP